MVQKIPTPFKTSLPTLLLPCFLKISQEGDEEEVDEMEDDEEGEDAISMEEQGDENEDNGDDQTMDDEDDDDVVEISGKKEQDKTRGSDFSDFKGTLQNWFVLTKQLLAV